MKGNCNRLKGITMYTIVFGSNKPNVKKVILKKTVIRENRTWIVGVLDDMKDYCKLCYWEL